MKTPYSNKYLALRGVIVLLCLYGCLTAVASFGATTAHSTIMGLPSWHLIWTPIYPIPIPVLY